MIFFDLGHEFDATASVYVAAVTVAAGWLFDSWFS